MSALRSRSPSSLRCGRQGSEKDKRKEFDGIRVGFDEKTITIREGADEENPDGGVEFKFERSNVALIRLALDF